MNNIDIKKTRKELMSDHPACRVKVAQDKREIVAEITDGFAVAVVERSLPHFHGKIRETYRVQRGTLCVACAGQGYVLREGESITIEPGQIHFARSAGEPAWIEVRSSPPWSMEDHFVL